MSNWTENILTGDSLKCLPLLCYIHHHHHHHHRYKAGSITGPFSVWLIFKAWQKASWWDIKWTTWSGLVAISQQSQTKDPCDFWHIWCYDNKASALMKQLKNKWPKVYQEHILHSTSIHLHHWWMEPRFHVADSNEDWSLFFSSIFCCSILVRPYKTVALVSAVLHELQGLMWSPFRDGVFF